MSSKAQACLRLTRISYSGQSVSNADRLMLVEKVMIGCCGVGWPGPLPEPPAAGTNLSLVCPSVTLHRAIKHSCGHPATGSASSSLMYTAL